jgi:hypothetical protein
MFSNESWPWHGVFAMHNFGGSPREKTMTGAMKALNIAVGVAVLICCLPKTRLQNRRTLSGFSRDRFGSVGGADIGVGGGGGDGGGAINNPRKDLHSRLTSQTLLDSFQSVSGISLESLEKTVFPFASGGALEYRWASLRIQARRFNDCLFLPRPQ